MDRRPASGEAGVSALAMGQPVYVNLNNGENLPYLGETVTLLGVRNNVASVSVDGDTCKLAVARLALPTVINGVRVFLVDTRPMATLITDAYFPLIHAALTACRAFPPSRGDLRYVP